MKSKVILSVFLNIHVSCPLFQDIELNYLLLILCQGDIAQMVERSLSMREVSGSIPDISNKFLRFAKIKIQKNGPILIGCIC